MLSHPAIIGEFALSRLRDRRTVLSFLNAQRDVTVATHDEVMGTVDRHELFNMGIGYADAHLLASILIHNRAELWTNDKRLQAAAQKEKLAFIDRLRSRANDLLRFASPSGTP